MMMQSVINLIMTSTHHLDDFGEVFVEVGDFEWMFVGLWWWGILDVRRVYLRKVKKKYKLKFQISLSIAQLKWFIE